MTKPVLPSPLSAEPMPPAGAQLARQPAPPAPSHAELLREIARRPLAAPSPLGELLARLDPIPLAYAPPAVRADELAPVLGRALALAAAFVAEYPALKAALRTHPDIAQTGRVLHAAAMIEYFCSRLQERALPIVSTPVGRAADELQHSRDS